MSLSQQEFSDYLIGSGLLSADELTSFLSQVDPVQRPQDGEQLGRLLVRAKLLTPYQAQCVYSGQTRGLVLGNYSVVDKLGQGGMGLVLKAVHRRMRRTVALKILSQAALNSPTLVERFQREVRAAAKLEHPNIVTAFDADEDRGVHFLVMQFVDGHDLSSTVKTRGPLPVAEAVEYLLQAARGLEYAHQHGVVHRDIKPGNLLLGKDGVVKVLDMGLARIDDPTGAAEGNLTTTGAVMGTIDYMSPEQALDTKHADARSDIYSLGCTLFYLLTGRAMYVADTTMKRLLMHREEPVPSLVEVLGNADPGMAIPGLLKAVDAIFQRMVAKRPEDRFATMTEVVAALSACKPGGDHTAWESSRTGSRGDPVTWRSSSSGGTAVSATRPITDVSHDPAGMQTLASGLNEQTAPSVLTQFTFAGPTSVGATSARTQATLHPPAQKPLVRWGSVGVLAVSLCLAAGLYFTGALSGFTGALSSTPTPLSPPAKGGPGGVLPGAVAPTPPPAPQKLVLDESWPRGKVDDHWWGVVAQPTPLPGVVRWQVESAMPRGRTHAVSWNPAGDRLAAMSDEERLRIYRWDGKRLTLDQLAPSFVTSQGTALKWSPDGRWLAWKAFHGETVYTWNVEAQRFGPNFASLRGSNLAGWNRAGTVLATSGQDGGGYGVFLWSWPSGELLHALRGHGDLVTAVEWSHDDAWLASVDVKGVVRFWQADGTPGPTHQPDQIIGYSPVSWSPTQHVLALFGSDFHVQLLHPDGTPGSRWPTGKPGCQSAVFRWLADGNTLLAQLPDECAMSVRRMDGTVQTRLETMGPAYICLQRPGSRELLNADGNRNLVTEVEQGRLLGFVGQLPLQTADWTSDGRWLAGANVNGELLIWDGDQKLVAATHPTGQASIQGLAWNRTSQRLSAEAMPSIHWAGPSTIQLWQPDGQQVARQSFPQRALNHGWSNQDRDWVVSVSGLSPQWLDPVTAKLLPSRTISLPNGLRPFRVFGAPNDERLLVFVYLPNGHAMYLVNPAKDATQLLKTPEFTSLFAAGWSHDGARLAVGMQSGNPPRQNIEIWEPSLPVRVASVPDLHSRVAFSPDNRAVLGDSSNESRVFRPDNGGTLTSFAQFHQFEHGSGWSGDGKQVVLFSTERHTLDIHDVRPTVLDQSIPCPSVHDVAWSPDNQILAASTETGLLLTWAMPDGQPYWSHVALPDAQSATFSAGGKLLHASPRAAEHLRVLVEHDDGRIETLSWAAFQVLAQRSQRALWPKDANTPEAQRDLAKYILTKLRGSCTVRPIGTENVIDVAHLGALPREPFTVTFIIVKDQDSLAPNDFEPLRAGIAVEGMSLANLDLTDAHWQAICSLPVLTQLTIHGGALTPSQLALLEQCDSLSFLCLDAMPLSSATIARVRRAFPHCRFLGLLATLSDTQGLAFDGVDDYVEQSHLTYDPSQPLTVEAWVTPQGTSAEPQNLVTFLGQQWIALWTGSGRWGLAAVGPDGTRIVQAEGPAATDRRLHVAGVWNGDELRLFVDGQPQSTAETSANYGPGTTGLYLGGVPQDKLPHDGARFFRGQLHAIRLSRGVKYQGAFEPPAEFDCDRNTLGLYRADPTQRGVLHDLSPRVLDAQIFGATVVGASDGKP